MRVDLVGLTINKVPSIRALQRLLDFFVSGVGLSKKDVVSDARVEKNWLLPNVSNLVAQMSKFDFLKLFVIDPNGSVCRIVESFNQLDDGAFSRAGWANNRGRLASLKGP